VWLRDYEALLRTARLLAGVPGLEFHLVAPEFPLHAGAGNVFFHAGIGDAELLELYRSCQVLFLPLRDATANTFLMEGAACGLPIVSSDLPALRAYFPGEEAILVKGNDPQAFAAALTRLRDEPGRVARMSTCARRRALQLSWERIAPEYEQLYDRVLAGPGRK
jgi:glycosyltransferase involved in cell wall biosynthesis